MPEQYTLEIAVSLPGGRLASLGGTPARRATTLDQIRELRAHLLYARGRRPAFQSPTGRYVDPDPADEHAYHVVAADRSGALIGCIRLAKAELLRPSAVHAHLGDRAARVVADVDATPSQILEAGRFTVAEDRRGQGLAAVLILACIALAQRVGRPVIWGISGTRDRQHLLFQRFGSRVLTDSTAYVSKYDDELCVGVFDRRTLGSEFNTAITRLCGVLFTDSQTNRPEGRDT
jgi:predicted GNAT family N-acyltransferase